MSSHSEKLANELASHQELLAWLEKQPRESQIEDANTTLAKLLQEAGQPKSVSGNACVRLCGFVEHFSKSESDQLRNWAFSKDVAHQLFTFYVEWNESDQHRSMKLVLDLLTRLQKRNPDVSAARDIENSLLDELISIIVGLLKKPVAKSAIKTLDYFVSKKIYSVDDIRLSYIRSLPELEPCGELEIWHKFFSELFSWVKIHFVCPTAGRFMVCLYRCLRDAKKRPQIILTPEIWHEWLLEFLREDPSLLEPVKNYIFLPLFKAERAEALGFLRVMASSEIITSNKDIDVDLPALVQLAALETGKRVGLVEEPSLNTGSQENDSKLSILVDQDMLNNVLAHPSHDVRSLAFSLLITSPSTTKPYSLTALNLLKQHLGTYVADPDAKFRVDVMARARDMFKRVRGAICVLKRSIPRVRAKALKRKASEQAPTTEGASSAPDAQPALYRSNLVDLPEEELVHCLEYHTEFLGWYIGFLCSELTPTASYQRHIGSLKAFSSILRIESDQNKYWGTDSDQEIFYDLIDNRWVRAMFDLVMDPFDDVRELSSASIRSILSDRRYRKFSLSGANRNESPVDELQDLANRANELARRTARADYSDGAARACQLLYRFSGDETQQLEFVSRIIDKLEAKITLAESNLGQAVLEDPVHGDFSALRYIWQIVSTQSFTRPALDTGKAVQDRLVSCCERIWHAVRDILCDDSPEGHLPQELEEVDGINTKDILSYSFRAIHESSNLVRAMTLTIKNGSQGKLISPSLDSFKRMGDLSFIQLSTLRHRGAFSTVSSTFSTCCQQTQYLGQEAGSNILDVWYQGTMSAIFAQVSTTRRSAGIPSLMTGILSANAPSPSFEQVMEKLIEISGIEAFVRETDGSNLPQVHAFNCLKDIFKSSFLTSMGNKSEKYLPQCLELAANGLRSEVWAIRNCGLILLRSLIDCLFGSNESKAMIEAGWDGKANRIPYHRYSTLPRVLVNLLESGHQMMSVTATSAAGAESVFPALDIIRRAGPPDDLREELLRHIATYLGSPVWHVREMAARTLCSCLLHDRWLIVMQDLLQQAIADQTTNIQNRIHGVLVSLKFVIERLAEVSPERLTANLSTLAELLHESKVYAHYTHCPDILAAYLEVINLIWSLLPSLKCELSSKSLELPISTTSESALLKIQNIKYQIVAAKFNGSSLDSLSTILLGKKLGVNTMLTALEALPQLWDIASTSSEALASFCALYINICLENSSLDIQTIALENLADIFENFSGQKKDTDLLKSLPLETLLESLLSYPLNPALSNAILRVSGSVVALMNLFGRLSGNKLQNWGIMMADAGLEDNTFDSRFAAAQSLHAFFLLTGANCTSEDFLPVLSSLYDTLNDDDDEVRDMGSLAVRAIIGQPLVSIEAATRLLQWLSAKFGNSTSFKALVAARIAGSTGTFTTNQEIPWKSADEQFDAAFKVDDSLFMVEDQNLFIDEIRETNRWISVYENLAWNPENTASKRLDEWSQRGLARLRNILAKEDGPLGWASDPEVFSICSRIILASVSLERKGHAHTALLEALGTTKDAIRHADARNARISGLLIKPLE